jgi:hypothetical protein
MLQAADDAEELIQDLRPILEGAPILVVMMALGELLAATLAHDHVPADAREAFIRSLVGRAQDIAGGAPRLH